MTQRSPRKFSSAPEAAPPIAECLEQTERVLICGHMRPDGDCIGSMSAMGRYLSAKGKEVRYFFLGPVQSVFQDILPAEPSQGFPVDFNADVTLCVDSSSRTRFGQDFQPKGAVVNIDHHHDNDAYGDLNWIGPEYAAVGQMLVDFFEVAVPEAWTSAIAGDLYLALSTDTGRFQYGNTTAEAFRAAALLVEKGADPAGIASRVWGNRSRESLRIESAVLGSVTFECGGRLAWAEERWNLLEENGGEINEPDNLSSAIRGIEGVEVGILLRETSDGDLRASFRSGGDIDVSALAAQFDGGGHPAAAGATIKGPFEPARDKIVAAAKQLF
ncbi:MAG: DHH family phosphoesterase [Candidatus Sumerlaeota bacterium]